MAALTSVTAEALLRDLDAEQSRAVTAEAPLVRVVAGAGSGKTRVLTHRVAHRAATGSAEAERCLVVTFTRSAAKELTDRLQRLGAGGAAHAGTLHSVAWNLLTRWLTDRGRSLPAIVDRRELLTRIARRAPQWRPEDEDSSALAGILQRYESYKRRRMLVDFDDVIAMCAQAFEDDPEFARAQRWRFRHIFVDEFQDLTPMQLRLLLAWAGDEPDLFIVGDPRQAIYEWNGSDPSLIEKISDEINPTETIVLRQNYRSSPAITSLAASFAGAVPLGVSGSTPLPTPRGDDQDDGRIPEVHRLGTAAEECTCIVRLTRACRARGVPWSAMGVLARTNARATEITSALQAAGVPLTATTFHKAKGREWETVVVSGAESLPLCSAGADAREKGGRRGDRPSRSDEEEARLLYVAMTRAARELHFTTSSRNHDAAFLGVVEACCTDLPMGREGLEGERARQELLKARIALRRS